jgi:hypothetical protein
MKKYIKKYLLIIYSGYKKFKLIIFWLYFILLKYYKMTTITFCRTIRSETHSIQSGTHDSGTHDSGTHDSGTSGNETRAATLREMLRIWNDRQPPIDILDFIELLNTEEETSVKTTEEATDNTTDKQKLLAVINYGKHYKMDPGTANIEDVKRSSAGIRGWSEDTN